jgi:NAD(P) transhydrogenase
MGGFLAAAPAVPAVATGYIGLNTLLSFIKGYTLATAVGGADMRTFFVRVIHWDML